MHQFCKLNIVRFTVEQIVLSDANGKRPVPQPEYHIVEADTVDGALDQFLVQNAAELIGGVQKFPGFHAVATARSRDTVFTVELTPGTDGFRRPRAEERR